MPEEKDYNLEEILVEIKCAHCFNDMAIDDSEREHFAFCSDQCRMKGRLFPTAEKMHNNLVRNMWRKNNPEKARAIALKSYHKCKKLTGRPVGRPRKGVHNSGEITT